MKRYYQSLLSALLFLSCFNTLHPMHFTYEHVPGDERDSYDCDDRCLDCTCFMLFWPCCLAWWAIEEGQTTYQHRKIMKAIDENNIRPEEESYLDKDGAEHNAVKWIDTAIEARKLAAFSTLASHKKVLEECVDDEGNDVWHKLVGAEWDDGITTLGGLLTTIDHKANTKKQTAISVAADKGYKHGALYLQRRSARENPTAAWYSYQNILQKQPTWANDLTDIRGTDPTTISHRSYQGGASAYYH